MEVAAGEHRRHVGVERVDVGRHLVRAQPELLAHEPVVLPVGVALVAAQPPHVLVVDEQRGVDDRGEDPQQQLRVVGGTG